MENEIDTLIARIDPELREKLIRVISRHGAGSNVLPEGRTVSHNVQLPYSIYADKFTTMALKWDRKELSISIHGYGGKLTAKSLDALIETLQEARSNMENS